MCRICGIHHPTQPIDESLLSTIPVEMRDKGIARAARFTWQETARQVADVYRTLWTGKET